MASSAIPLTDLIIDKVKHGWSSISNFCQFSGREMHVHKILYARRAFHLYICKLHVASTYMHTYIHRTYITCSVLSVQLPIQVPKKKKTQEASNIPDVMDLMHHLLRLNTYNPVYEIHLMLCQGPEPWYCPPLHPQNHLLPTQAWSDIVASRKKGGEGVIIHWASCAISSVQSHLPLLQPLELPWTIEVEGVFVTNEQHEMDCYVLRWKLALLFHQNGQPGLFPPLPRHEFGKRNGASILKEG